MNKINPLNYKIIKSGSSGNCVKIQNMLIDIGITKKELLEHVNLKDIKHILITHKHGDHVKKSTLKFLKTKNIFCNIDVYETFKDILQDFRNVFVFEDNQEFFVDSNIYVKAFRVDHDVLTHGFKFIINVKDTELNVLYCTDLQDTSTIPPFKYDYVFLEANYDYQKLKVAYQNPKNRNRLKNNFRHLSKEKSLNFFVKNSKPKAVYVKLHKSSQFY